jgi:hypothetical protein
VGDGPTLRTIRLSALPVTMWNAGYVAVELGLVVGLGVAAAAPAGAGGSVPPAGGDATDLLKRDLRRRASMSAETMTWVVRDTASTAVGLLTADTRGARVLVAASIGRPYRRRGYATETIRALASWLESRPRTIVEARIRTADLVAARLAIATAFVPTDVVLGEQWRVWFRPPLT